jgi:hydroxymethylpyrimidine pyrophosphatase-like HAD family hydrolase
MVKNSEVGVAVSNAIESVKAVADYICDAHDNNGVAKWIKQNVLC